MESPRSQAPDFVDPRTPDALKEATAARERAYAPYSGFRMGAAVVTDRGAVVPGSLVENVSLGLAMCAERVALFSSVAAEAGRPELLAVVSPRTRGRLTFPCGACLQVALELGGPELRVVAQDPSGCAEAPRRSRRASAFQGMTSLPTCS